MLGHEFRQLVRDPLVGIAGRSARRACRRGPSVPSGPLVDMPALDAQMFPACRRSWKCRSDRVAAGQRRVRARTHRTPTAGRRTTRLSRSNVKHLVKPNRQASLEARQLPDCVCCRIWLYGIKARRRWWRVVRSRWQPSPAGPAHRPAAPLSAGRRYAPSRGHRQRQRAQTTEQLTTRTRP
jgi:hypothetical protein